ncbi:MAG TPA: transketolase C-terminal domain-containing protein, partial [Puia sp.]|nr:transketolase C-terminal domain-containing protein [Puia sp.]
YPRGEGVMPEWRTPFKEIPIGRGRKLKDGRDLAILSFGHPGNFATAAIRTLRTEDIDPAHYDMRFVKPLDEELLHEVFQRYGKIITVEDGSLAGGFGSAILEFMTTHGYQAEIVMLGIPDKVVEHGSPKQLQHECGFDAEGIVAAAKKIFKEAAGKIVR